MRGTQRPACCGAVGKRQVNPAGRSRLFSFRGRRLTASLRAAQPHAAKASGFLHVQPANCTTARRCLKVRAQSDVMSENARRRILAMPRARSPNVTTREFRKLGEGA